jgi:hypothetical protein
MPQLFRKTSKSMLRLEELEPRLVLASSATVDVGIHETFGPQVVTIQGYGDSNRVSFGIFDTGAGAITFSQQDQAQFTSKGYPIPIQVYGGASAQGIGGSVVGDLSQPGTIWADGLHAAAVTVNSLGIVQFSPSFNSNSAQVPNVQVFVGTANGSPLVPTITGMPILVPSPAHPRGLAASITLQGFSLDLSGGLTQSMPDLSFVPPGTAFNPGGAPLEVGPFQIPLSLSGGGGDPTISGAVTEAPVPMVDGITVIGPAGSQGGQRFLLDTGAQLTVISPGVAASLGLDLQHPLTFAEIDGVGGIVKVPGFVVNELDVPDVGGVIRFHGVPVFVADIGSGMGGILGMNVLDSSAGVIYDPYGPSGPVLNIAFKQGLVIQNPGPGTDSLVGPGGGSSSGSGSSSGGSLSGGSLSGGSVSGGTGSPVRLPFQGAINGTNLPFFQVNSGRITGQAFLDFNHNGIPDTGEPTLPGQTIYLDLNHDGTMDPGDPSTPTGPGGFFEFSRLAPGSYTVREIVPAYLTQLPGMAPAAAVTVQDNATTAGVNFGNARLEPDPQTAFIAALYGDILDRAPDLAGLNYFTQWMDQGASHDQVAQAMWESPEHRGMQVDQYYEGFLHRPADASGRTYWITAFQAGASEADVQTAFLLSPEYQAAHASDAAYLSGLYNDLLGRSIDSVGAAAWEQQLQHGATRGQVAQLILGSDEFNLRTIDGYYALLLHRTADSGGRQAWLYLLQHGQKSIDGVAEALLGSLEYSNWSHQLSNS